MAILSQHNPLRFFADKRSRTWDKNPESRCSELVFYPNTNISGFGNTPAFSLDVDDYTTAGADIYDSDDNWVNGLVYSTAVDKTTYTQLYFASEGMSLTKGYYYILLSIDDVLYYSDVFGVTDSLDEHLKINVDSANLTVGGLPLEISTLFTEFYLSADYLGIKPKIDQQGDLIDGITQVNFGTRVFTREYEIDANESIFIYMSAIGMMGVNGTVTITWFYESFTASDILVEESTNHFNETYQIKLSFVDERESVQTLNSING